MEKAKDQAARASSAAPMEKAKDLAARASSAASSAATSGARQAAPVVAKGAAAAADLAAVGARQAAPVVAKGAAAAADLAARGAATAAERGERGAKALVGEEHVTCAKDMALAAKSTAKAAAGQFASTIEEEARAQAFVLIGKGVDRAMPRLAAHMKKELVDPDMPSTVVRGLEAIVDTAMEEVRDLLAESLTETVLKKAADERISAPPPNCCSGGGVCSPFAWVRAKILYTLFPHDRSMWASFRSPWWWLLTLLGVFPLWGVRVAWWVLVFLLKDKGDDYQLCAFVIACKASLFLSGGIQSALLATAIFQACLEASSCEAKGDALGGAPGSNPAGFEFGLLGALVQSVCCWVAMCLLPWASPQGGKLYDLSADLSRRTVERRSSPTAPKGRGLWHLCVCGATSKGGRLWYFMWYDTIILLCCIAGGAFAWFGTTEPDHIVRSRVFHIRMLYSIMAFPWLILKLPLAYTLVLHLKPTGYNQAGQVVRLCNSKERRAARDKRAGLAVPGHGSSRKSAIAAAAAQDLEEAQPAAIACTTHGDL